MNEQTAYEAVGSLYALAAALFNSDDEGFTLLASQSPDSGLLLDAATVAVAQTALLVGERDGLTLSEALADEGPLGEVDPHLRAAALGAARRLEDDEIRDLRKGMSGDPVRASATAVAKSWDARWGAQAHERSKELCLAIAVNRDAVGD